MISNEALWGQRDPDRAYRRYFMWLGAGIALATHAMVIQVVPHPLLRSWPMAAVMLALGIWITVRVMRFNLGRGRMANSPGARVACWLLLPVLFGAIAWMVASKTPGWLAAITFGSPHAQVHELDVRSHGEFRLHCPFELRGPSLRMFPARVCVDKAYYRQHARQRVRVQVTGERTLLGFRITGFEHIEALGPADTARPIGAIQARPPRPQAGE